MDPAEIIKQMHEQAQKGVLCMWTIYDKPTDFPDHFRRQTARCRQGRQATPRRACL